MILPIALAGAQAAYQGYQGIRQQQLANKLRKRGPLDPTPNAYRQAQAGAENMANNGQISGYGQALDQINQGTANAVGNAKRAGTSSADVLSVLSRVNNNELASKRVLALEGQQAKERRMAEARKMQVGRGEYQELGRQENNAAIGALEGASKQNFYGALTSGVGLATMAEKPGIPDGPGNVDQMAQYETPDQLAQYEAQVQTSALPERNPQMVPYQFGADNSANNPYFDPRKNLGPAYLNQFRSGTQPYPIPGSVPSTQGGTYLPQSYQDLYKRKFGY